MKLPGHPVRTGQARRASRKGNIVLTAPLPACPAVGRDRRRAVQGPRLPRFGGTGHLPVTILQLFPWPPIRPRRFIHSTFRDKA